MPAACGMKAAGARLVYTTRCTRPRAPGTFDRWFEFQAGARARALGGRERESRACEPRGGREPSPSLPVFCASRFGRGRGERSGWPREVVGRASTRQARGSNSSSNMCIYMLHIYEREMIVCLRSARMHRGIRCSRSSVYIPSVSTLPC